MEKNVFKDNFELGSEDLVSYGFMPRVHDVNKPCRWLTSCKNGKCPALKRLGGNLYCAKKNNH